jgi:serine/threonine protein phosphatase PrpC
VSRARPLRAAAASDAGRERGNNEDRVLCAPELGIFAVIDGVGGESAGEVAADTALEVLRARLSRRTTDAARLVREAIALANRQIHERALADPKLAGMACVLTVAVLDGSDSRASRATVGHVGDSRLYSLSAGEIRKVTHDHSPVGTQEDEGRLSESEAMRHPRRNEIFRDVGSEAHEPDEEGWIEIVEVPFDPASALLLCSDGLSDMIPAREILAAVEANAASPEAAVRALVQRANAAGGKDNVSAVLVAGDRFAEAVARRRAQAGKAPGTLAGGRWSGAAHARSGAGAALARALPLLLALLALAAAGLALFREPLARWAGVGGGAGGGGSAGELVVGIGDGGFATIGEALGQARPGQTVEVAPGEYRERIALPAGVALVSRTPRGAVLLPPVDATGARGGGPAVSARGVRGARLSGFRIAGVPGAPWGVGVRLDGSEVALEDLEVTRCAGSGIEIGGADRSTVGRAFVHHNGGAGIAVGGEAAPRLLGNLILGNGLRPGSPAPGVDVREAAAPLLVDNRIEGNGGPGVALPAAAAERAEEVFRWNAFGALPREQAVRVAGAPPGGAPGPVARPALSGAAAPPRAPAPATPQTPRPASPARRPR